MEIEIMTTKKKLTKSIVTQMCRASTTILKCGEPLGFIANIVKHCPKAILIKHGDNYYTFPANYRKIEGSVYRNVGRRLEHLNFNTPKQCNLWWDRYQKVIKLASNQIYI